MEYDEDQEESAFPNALTDPPRPRTAFEEALAKRVAELGPQHVWIGGCCFTII
jgi:hypothetical protein